MKMLKRIFVFVCILSILITSISPNDVQITQARELGKGSASNLIEDANIKFSLKNFPKVWTGNYDGSHGSTPVNRKYALKINSIDEATGNFIGISYVDKGTDKPNYQHKAIFNVSGNINIEKNAITWKRGEAIDNPGGLTWIEFTAQYGKDYKMISGSTTAYDTAKVNLSNAKLSDVRTTLGIDTDNFNYNENTLNYDLANECMELSLLIYGESCDDGAGYYTKAKGTAAAKQTLAKRLISDNFESQNYVFGCDIKSKESVPLSVHLNTSSLKENDTKDCIHWVSAEKKLSDGTKLIYVIVKGTTGSEWYGNFNVASKEGDGTYNSENAGKHYSFESSAEALVQDLNERYKNETNKIKYVVTGHSRGAAVANIVAKKLTDRKKSDDNNYDSRIESVYGYTFATPTTISKNEQGNYKNIFNFCFDDDFVTYMPLSDANWQYGRYGTTYCVTAANLNKKYALFRTVANNYFGNISGNKWVSYKEKGAYDIAEYLTSKCDSVENFYERDKYIDTTENIKNYGSWYDFFHKTFASLMASKYDKVDYRALINNEEFKSVFGKFVVGALGYVGVFDNSIQAYVGNTHDPGSYYALTQLLKYKDEADAELVDIEKSKLRKKLATAYPASDADIGKLALKSKSQTSLRTVADNLYKEEQVNALKTFANTDTNLSLLGWNLDDPSTWKGIEWNSDGNVTAINIDSIGLSGKLDVSSFNSLDVLECTNNRLTDLILPDKDNMDVYCDGNYLSINPKNELYKRLIQYANNGSNISFTNQCVPENAKFNSTELTKLKEFANTNKNLEILGWDIDNPASYVGIQWILINGTYYVDKINLSDLQLSGTVDISKFAYVKEIDLSNNNIIEVNVSGCGSLEKLNVCSNKITQLNISNLSKLNTLFCSDNYLVNNLSDDIVALKAQDKDAVVEIFPQYTDSSAEEFDEKELEILKDFIGETITDIDWEHPGLNNYFQWKKIGNKYYLESLDLGGTEISGNIDLSEFTYLSKVNFFKTNISGIILPSSTTESDDYAFAYCPNLTSVSVTDSWTSMGTDVFYESPNVSLSCTRNTFAEFIAEALDIPFNEVVALAYLEVDGKATEYYLQGEDFDLNGAELKVYYSDETTKNITEGYVVEGYDANKLGKQTVTLSYSEDNYTKSTTIDIIVYGHTDNGLLYLFTDNKENKIQITGYIGEDEKITIPPTINDVNVVKIADNAFEGNETVSSITISDPITELGSHSFKGCMNLTSITLPKSLKVLGTYSFEECDNLNKITLPTSVTKIPEGAFYNCDNLSQISINGELQYIDSYAFKDCISMKSFDFGNNLKEIGTEAFSGCASLESANMPDSITGLGTYIFKNCTSIKNAHINEGRINIMEGMFYGCEKLEEVNIPNTVENIRADAFRGCKGLNEIKLPESVKLIESSAFRDCSSLQKFEFSSNLSEIGANAFDGCTSLEQAIMPDTISSLGNLAFANCTSLKKVHINEGRINISEGFFENCSSLQEVNIPDSVEYIRTKAFYGCTSLNSLTLPEGLKKIESNAFSGAKIGSIEFSGNEGQLKAIDISTSGNETILESSIKTLADGKNVVLKSSITNDNTGTSSPSPSPSSSSNGKKNLSSNKGDGKTSSSKVNKPGKVTGLKIKNKKKRKMIISWNWKVNMSGFQIQYAQNKKFTKKRKSKTVGKWTSRKTITKLKKGKTYYVRVRAYKKSSGKKIYGSWSKIKKVKIKK